MNEWPCIVCEWCRGAPGRLHAGANDPCVPVCGGCYPTMPTRPPTLREWLGHAVAELGRWADVLRERPVPAGWIASWEWDAPARVWRCHGYMSGYGAKSFTMFPSDAVSALVGDDIRAHDAYRMSLAVRHPDVMPNPTPAALPWDPEAA